MSEDNSHELHDCYEKLIVMFMKLLEMGPGGVFHDIPNKGIWDVRQGYIEDICKRQLSGK